MKRVEKSGEKPAEKGQNFGEKLSRVAKKGGQTTPVASFSRPQQLKNSASIAAPNTKQSQDCTKIETPFPVPCVSARKLAATLWELHHYNLQLDQMHHGTAAPLPRLRRLNHDQLYKDKNALEPLDPSPASIYPVANSIFFFFHLLCFFVFGGKNCG